MGSQQVKCQCGKFSEAKVVLDIGKPCVWPEFDKLKELTGYASWTYRGFVYEAFPCISCGEKICDRLDGIEDCGYEMTKSDTGFWKTDLP